MNQGRARLLLGTSCVGFMVVASSALLVSGALEHLFPVTEGNMSTEFVALLTFFTAVAFVMIPFDVLGGVVIPTHVEKQEVILSQWLRQWTFSVVFQIILYAFTLQLYLEVGRALGTTAVVIAFVLMQVILLSVQQFIWKLVSGNAALTAEGNSTKIVSHRDHRFTGGILGLPGRETILIPMNWKQRLSPQSFQLFVKRRQAAIRSGGRWRGLLLAMAWNTVSLGIAISITDAAFASVASVLTVYLTFLLFSFAGLLLLPALNRSSVFALDAVSKKFLSGHDLQSAIAEVDQITDRDPERDVASESIFQPIPCPSRRIETMANSNASFVSAWHVARSTLYLSWAFGGPLARAVHCNVGRPELWVILPAD